MADLLFNSFKADIMNGNIDLDTDTIKVMLLTSSHTTNIDTQEKRSNIEGDEVSGTGYTAGGKTLTTPAVAIDDANDRGTFDGDDITWSASTITAAYAVLYKSRGGASSADELIGVWDFGGNKVSSNGDFTININAIGVLTLT